MTARDMTALSGKKIAGGSWVDETAFHCEAEGWVRFTSRNPDDLPAFSSTLTDVFAKA